MRKEPRLASALFHARSIFRVKVSAGLKLRPPTTVLKVVS
jgi:hypothetical protein